MDPEELEKMPAKEVVGKVVEIFNDPDANPDEVDDLVDCFLYAYSPEHNFSIIEDNNEILKDVDLLNICMGKCMKSYTPEIFLEFVNLLSALEGFEIAMAKENAVQAIVQMMLKDKDNDRTLVLGAKALGNLARNPHVRKWIGKCKGIHRVLTALEKFKDKPESVLHYLGAIINMLFKCTENKVTFINLKGIELILQVMEIHKKSLGLCVRALTVLRNTSASGLVTELNQHTLLRTVINLMELHKSNATVQIHGLWTVVNLISKDVDLKRYISLNFTITIDRILGDMETHQANPLVQLPAATAISLLCKLSSCRNLIVKNHHNGIPLLLSILTFHADNIPIQRAILKVFSRLANNLAIRDELGKSTLPSAILNALTQHKSNGPLQRAGCVCLLALLKNSEGSGKGHVYDIVLKDGIPHINKTMKDYQGHPQVENVARRLIDVILKPSGSSREKAWSTGISLKNKLVISGGVEEGDEGIRAHRDQKEEKELDQLREELAAARKQLAERGKLLAKTQKKLDQSEGEKLKYKNQLRAYERKIKKTEQAAAGGPHKHTDTKITSPRTNESVYAKSNVLAEIKARKQQLDEQKKMEHKVQENKSALLEEIRKMKKDDPKKEKQHTPEQKRKQHKSPRSENSNEETIAPSPTTSATADKPSTDTESDDKRSLPEEKSEEKSEEVKEDSGVPVFTKNQFTIIMENDIRRSIPFDPLSKLKDCLDPIVKARKIELENWSVFKPDGTLLSDHEVQLCSLGVLEIRFLPNSDEMIEEFKNKQLVRRTSSKESKEKKIRPNKGTEAEVGEDAKMGKDSKVKGITKILKRKSQPRMPLRTEKEKRPASIVITAKPPPPPPAPAVAGAEIRRKNSDPTRHKRGSSAGGPPDPSGSTVSPPPPPPPPHIPSPPAHQHHSNQNLTPETRHITNRRADKTPRETTSTKITEYKEEIEMMKEDLIAMKNLLQKQEEKIVSLETERETDKATIAQLNEALAKVQSDIKLSAQLASSSTPRVSDGTSISPRNHARLQKRNKELQSQNESLKAELDKLKSQLSSVAAAALPSPSPSEAEKSDNLLQ